MQRVLLAPLVALLGACSPATPGPPDVVLITLDTVRADYLSSYGHPDHTTPNLDRLAREGTRFDLAISSSALTPVSHAAILTGRYNHEHGLRVLSADGGFRLDDEVPTLATILARNGYQTAAIHSSFAVSSHFGLDQGFDRFDGFDAAPREPDETALQYQRRSDETSDLVVRYLQHAPSPFFLWIHYWDPHDDTLVPPKSEAPPPAEVQAAQAIADPVERLMEFKRLLYRAEVRYQDGQIGRVLRALDERLPDRRTLIAVVSDHGEGLGDHLWWAHRILYQEQIRVPLILRIPGVEQEPLVPELVRTIDLAPTILDYLGIEAPPGISGRSLRDMIEGRSGERRIAFSDQINGYDANASMLRQRPFDDFLYSVTDGEQKLIYRPAHPEKSELFDLRADPLEERNLYASRPYDVLRWQQALAREAPWVTAPFEAADDAGVAEQTIAALEALGYLARDDGAPADEPRFEWICPDRPNERRASASARGECSSALIPIASTATP